ncbi:outer membrane beta-barrel protein [Vibrio sagamiensis]|uniref:Outer membrane protein OmpA-like transmembrane domain-containing protein n=1 Tax=Vibrio sagamiensis NBRC 104589 TaxID=1219064 RepID=A0A511QIS0_9VIBR|nr:outer membrane beta-barrel protein [Vibrio sagamiensis]GEM77077.1 hypothetical protein VSA01S_31890 [Vibrio sagamiensis NBRC 104589]
MKKKNSYIYCILIFISISLPLKAFEGDFKQNWYLGGSIGIGDYGEIKNKSAYNNETIHLAGDAHLGFVMNKYVASELSYQYLGKAYAQYSLGHIKANFQQLVLSTKIGYPVENVFYPYARIGGAAWLGESHGLREANEQGFAPVVGGGIEYVFNSALVTRLDYQYTKSLGNEKVGHTNHHMLTVGFDWYFDYL